MSIKSVLFATFILASTALPIGAQDTKSALKRGDAFVAQENYKAAIEEYRKVSSRDRDAYARAIYNIGVCYYELWQTEEAIASYKRAIELKLGNYPVASYALGVALEDHGRFAEAKVAFEQASNYAPAIYKLGLLAAKAGELTKAAALFRDAAAREGRHVAASHNNLGVVLARLGFLKEAEKEFVIALKSSNGVFEDASQNLKLCRTLMNSIELVATVNWRN
ncbi:MAG TPA: tetratricopeptide repeat protein [Pyrinomonadaceae bacterium]|nr:tetratricopeptide repeat protein [Pyrinomonadaceae bacterium]